MCLLCDEERLYAIYQAQQAKLAAQEKVAAEKPAEPEAATPAADGSQAA
jgi:hypothetical protein